eukprot:CAMPEP_0201664750 /NCGR_PEP_ID=MMETSP0494-20130426/6111_1 /ASSEMBLY_ACC=CAM_ASM_000839 /TAXON_ID=420259 /ORGANISM="Thalassiosira gravida, Strain GMp14c1" /LENGTH=831 /DNA_ID=CAMNT_0048143579 /DNA_START=40 /DNA_END=2532 /DNA_ORIENTATION=+
MNRLRNFISGSSEYDDDNNYPPDNNQNNNNNNQSSWNSKYGYTNNSNSNNNTNSKQQRSQYQSDDLYLSDDDDWGMSSSFSAQNTLRERDRYGHSGTTTGGQGQFSMEGRRSSSAFWDQSSLDDNGGGGVGGGGLGDTEMMSSTSKRGLQEWEREAITRDNNNSNNNQSFEIGNDDYYHSEQRSPPSSRPSSSSSSTGSSPLGNRNNNAYAEVQEDIRSIDNSVEDDDNDDDDDDDDTASSASSKQDEVVNAYRDYLKSIRDGGFESYLTTDNEGGGGAGEEYDMTPDFNNHNNNNTGQVNDNDHGEDEALERVLDVEEERRVNGSYYGHVYGVRDVRTSNNDDEGGVVATDVEDQSSPYNAWRAKAKALLQQEREKDRRDMISPSRQILNKFRRQRGGGNNGNGSRTRGRARSRGDEDNDRIGIADNFHSASASINGYRLAMCRSMKFRAACIGVCMMLALVAGLSYYGGKSTSTTADDGGDGGVDKEEDGVPDVAIPPKSNGGTSKSSANMNDNSQNLPAGPSDAIINALATFDPIWYDRRSGWEGITFMNAVDFCATHENRVPCPYEIYCNQAAATTANGGSASTPYRGIRPNGEQWSPISNGANQWVSVGGIFTCQRYTDLHDHKKPEWGITGVSLEHDHGAGGITQNVMCCIDLYNIGALDPFTEWGRQEEMDSVAADMTHETTDMAAVNVPDAIDEKDPTNAGGNVAASSHNDDLDSQKREKAVIAAFQPIWFSSAHGWTGTSYEDAILFCESYNHMVLCPYAAYCPNGNARAALPGSMVTELDGEEWVPANGPMNTWVQIGMVDGEESTRCTLHHELLGERPQW